MWRFRFSIVSHTVEILSFQLYSVFSNYLDFFVQKSSLNLAASMRFVLHNWYFAPVAFIRFDEMRLHANANSHVKILSTWSKHIGEILGVALAHEKFSNAPNITASHIDTAKRVARIKSKYLVEKSNCHLIELTFTTRTRVHHRTNANRLMRKRNKRINNNFVSHLVFGQIVWRN